jgi:hypothetical protein
MTSPSKKAAIGSLAALTLAVGVLAGPTPASAWHYGYWYPYGRHGGYHDWGGAVAAGVLGGVALGALAGSAYAYGPAFYSYGGCYWQNQPAYDGWGNFVGYQPVEVCY